VTGHLLVGTIGSGPNRSIGGRRGLAAVWQTAPVGSDPCGTPITRSPPHRLRVAARRSPTVEARLCAVHGGRQSVAVPARAALW